MNRSRRYNIGYMLASVEDHRLAAAAAARPHVSPDDAICHGRRSVHALMRRPVLSQCISLSSAIFDRL